VFTVIIASNECIISIIVKYYYQKLYAMLLVLVSTIITNFYTKSIRKCITERS